MAYAAATGDPGIASYGAVIADALAAAGLTSQSAADVRLRVDADGITSIDLPGPAAEAFARSLEELLAAPALPRYVVARPRLPSPAGRSSRLRASLARAAFRQRLDVPIVVHSVPSAFAVNAAGARSFGTGWQRWIAVTDPVYTGSPDGAGLLASATGDAPVGLEVALRTRWQ